MPVIVTLFWLWAKGYEVNWLMGLWALASIILVHAAGNVWSDYFDYKKGVDAPDTYGVKILTSGQFTPAEVMRLSVGIQIAAVLSGIGMVLATGLPLLWIGLIGIALSLLYPPLKYMALGDLVIALCYSVLPMLGVTFIITGSIIPNVLWLAVPVGCITIAILQANDERDIETDIRAGISTIATATGRKFAAWLYCAEMVIPYVWTVGIVIAGLIPWTCLTVLLSAPLAVANFKTALSYKTGGIAAIGSLDEMTAKLQLAFSFLLALGLALSLLF